MVCKVICKNCQRKYGRHYMNEKYKDPEFYQIQLYHNSLNRINNKPPGYHDKLLGCQDLFYLKWLKYQREDYEIVTGCKIKVEEIDHVHLNV